jgi:hypothetical protein
VEELLLKRPLLVARLVLAPAAADEHDDGEDDRDADCGACG